MVKAVFLMRYTCLEGSVYNLRTVTKFQLLKKTIKQNIKDPLDIIIFQYVFKVFPAGFL